MGRISGSFDAKGLEDFQKKLEKIQASDLDAFVQSCAKELAARLLRLAIKRTPVGQYPSGSGKVGGTLRRGWTAKTQEEAAGGKNTAAATYAASLPITHEGDTYTVEIINPVEYASYVEFGHRTANHKGWVEGQFMLTISEQELQRAAPGILERKINKFLKECMQ